jgi:hypothetical protein
VLRSVPIPNHALPDPADDAHLVVHDLSSSCVYEFWGASKTDGRWSAQWGSAISSDSSGVYSGGLAARASGLSAAAGLILPEELRRGSINHALVFAYPYTRIGGPVAPATSSDGTSSAPVALPEGARVQLDPTLDVTALDLTPTEETIARALQEYGMILGDSSGGLTLYAAHPQSQPEGSYDGLLPADTWVSLAKIPADRFRVLELTDIGVRANRPEQNDCAVYS